MNLWRAVAGEGARLKREQLEREIARLPDETDRANLSHTMSKLFMFLEDDLAVALRRAGQTYPMATMRNDTRRIVDLGTQMTAMSPDDPEELLKMIGNLMERIHELEQPCAQCAIRHDAQVKLTDLLAEQKAENKTLRERLERLRPNLTSQGSKQV